MVLTGPRDLIPIFRLFLLEYLELLIWNHDWFFFFFPLVLRSHQNNVFTGKICTDERLTLETPALKFFTVANLRYRLIWWYQITLLHSPTDAAPQFLEKLTLFIQLFCAAGDTFTVALVSQLERSHSSCQRILGG